MKAALVFLALGHSQIPVCQWSAEKTEDGWQIEHIANGYSNDPVITRVFNEQHGPVFYAGCGELNIEDKRGEFWTHDYTTERVGYQIKSVNLKSDTTAIDIDFGDAIITMDCARPNGKAGMLQVAENAKTNACESIDRVWLRFDSESPEEAAYGAGEQYSYFNLRGRKFPILTREQGMGRNLTELVSFVSRRCCDAAGDYHHTYWPQSTVVLKGNSRSFYLNFWHDAFSILDFSSENFHEFEFHKSTSKKNFAIAFDFDSAPDYAMTVQKLALSYGKQEKLPRWVTKGTIIGLQGGTDRIMEIYERSKLRDIDVNGIWIQDWSGQIFTDFGDRVFWNWEWNSTQYPGLDELIPEMSERGVYFLNYINPHFINSPDSDLYVFGEEKGYFVKNKTTGETLLQNFGFDPFKVVTIDLSNPSAAKWFKDEVIIKNTIEFGFKGWMADFGEYLPYAEDVAFWDGDDGTEWHNKFSERWANLNMQALIETNTLGEIFFFSRAGWNGMRTSSTSAWAGDQNVDFSYGDGLATTITAALSLGASGFGLTHFDIGGYTAMPPLIRTKELFLRSAEAAVFTPVMRTHEGNRPGDSWQYYCNRCTMKLYARLVKAHNTLVDYIDFLMQENTENGAPVQRPMIWLANEASGTFLDDMQTQYMLGDDIVVAPVIRRGHSEWKLYIPEGTWRWVWNAQIEVQGPVDGYSVKADVGFPPAFYRVGSRFEADFAQIEKFAELPGCTVDTIFPTCNEYHKNSDHSYNEDIEDLAMFDDFNW